LREKDHFDDNDDDDDDDDDNDDDDDDNDDDDSIIIRSVHYIKLPSGPLKHGGRNGHLFIYRRISDR